MTITSKSYENYRHAAVVLKSLTKATADQFLAQLAPSLSQKIVMEMRRTHVTASNLREAILELKSAENDLTSRDENFSVEGKVFRMEDARANATYGVHSGVNSQPNLDFSKTQTVKFEKEPFRFLTNQSPEALNQLFNGLKVRSAAVILSSMSFEFAAQRLKAINGARKVDIMRAISDLDDLHPAEVADLKFAVQLQIQKMVKDGPKPVRKSPSVSRVTLGKTPQKQIVRKKKSDDPNRLTLIQQGKLIAGLLDLPDAKVKELLKTIDTATLAPALKMCPIAVQKKVLKNMAKKPAKIVSKEMLNIRVDEKHRMNKARLNIATAIEKLTK